MLNNLTESEAYDQVLELQRVAGISSELLVCDDTADTTRTHQRAFLGRLRELAPIQYAGPDRFTAAMKIRELI